MTTIYATTAKVNPCNGAEQIPTDHLIQAIRLLDDLNERAVSALFRVHGLESCARGVCCAKARTLAERMGCSARTVRRALADLTENRLIVKVRRRCRTADRAVTELGRSVVRVIVNGGYLWLAAELERRGVSGASNAEAAASIDRAIGPCERPIRSIRAAHRQPASAQVSAQMSAHKGEAEHPRGNSSRISQSSNRADPTEPAHRDRQAATGHRGASGGATGGYGAIRGQERPQAAPRRSPAANPAAYTIPKTRGSLGRRAWDSLAQWLATAKTVSWARCRVTHNAFSRLAVAIQRTPEWPGFTRAMAARGQWVAADDLIGLCAADAVKRRKSFVTVESAVSYAFVIARACIRERRLPGEAFS